MLDNIRHDYARIREIRESTSPLFLFECLLFENGFVAVLFHRMAHWFKSRGVPFLGPFFGRCGQLLTGVEIGPGAVIGPGLFISHGWGTVIGGETRIGKRAFLLQQVTLGAPSQGRLAQMPTVGDDVFIGAGAKVIGDVRVGDRVFIGVNAVVTCDVPSDSKVVSTAEVRITPRETTADGCGAEGASNSESETSVEARVAP